MTCEREVGRAKVRQQISTSRLPTHRPGASRFWGWGLLSIFLHQSSKKLWIVGQAGPRACFHARRRKLHVNQGCRIMAPTEKAATYWSNRRRASTRSSIATGVDAKIPDLAGFVLFLMSPLIAEVLLGATSLTHIGGLFLVAPFYGCGVLLIRELVRRRTTSWWPVVLFGAAYTLVEEGLSFQTLFNPDFVNAAKFGGRWHGVNFGLTQWEFGYHIRLEYLHSD